MTSNKDNTKGTFNLSEDLRNNYSFPNNSFENNSSENENKADNITANSYPSIHPNVNNPQNENDMLDDNRSYNIPNFDQSIDLNINNSQIGNNNFDNDKFSDSLYFPRSNDLKNNSQNEDATPNSLNSIISLNENDNIIHSISSNDINFHSPIYLNVNNPLNENISIENAKINDTLNFHQFINRLNANNSQIENDSIGNGSLNDGFNSKPLIDNINVNNPQFENDKINKTKVSKKTKQIFTISKRKKIFTEVKPRKISKRTDYNKKFFKSHFVKFLKNLANKIIQRSKLPIKLKKLKIYSPNSLSFQANTKESDNYKFLSFPIKKIFTFYIKKKCKDTFEYQKKCKENIKIILKFIDESEDESIYEEVKSFFNMTLEDAYELFCQDEEFKKFQEDPRVIEIDEEVKAINWVFLREKNGFIQLVKSHLKEN